MRGGAPKGRRSLRTCGCDRASGAGPTGDPRSRPVLFGHRPFACKEHRLSGMPHAAIIPVRGFEMSALTSRIHFQAARNDLGIDMMIEVGEQTLISLSLSRREIERMLEAISNALDENKDDHSTDDE